MENRENGRMILNSVQNGPLIWPTVTEEDGLPPDFYVIINQHKFAKEIWDRAKLLMQGTKLSLQEKEYPSIPDGQTTQTTIPNTAAFQTEDLDAYDYDCDDVSNAKAVLMTNLSNYGSDVISEVPHSDSYHNDMDDQSVHKAQRIKPTLYDGSVISKQHVASLVFDDDETLILEEEHIKSMRENDKEKKVKHEMDEIETINIELKHSVAKLLSKNECLHKEIEHLKKIYKDQYDSIKKTCALSKEHGDSLVAQLNSKSLENAALKRLIQDK
ncbi:hypothetical protein Tco_0018101, partial [Tanacetum coccineum]